MRLNEVTAFVQSVIPRKLYIKLRPVAGQVLEIFNWEVEKFSISGNNILLHKDYYFPNSELAEEIKGYFLKFKPKAGDVVIDAGAYSGFFTVLAAKLVGETGRVIAYEPDPFNRARLRRNLRLNKLQNVLVRPFGLYSKNTILQFEVRQVASRIAENLEAPIAVPMRTLDREVRELKIKKLNFVKMDVEGAEIEVLKGAKTLRDKFGPKIQWAIASYHLVNGKPTSEWLTKHFSKLGMRVQTSYKRHKTTYAWN